MDPTTTTLIVFSSLALGVVTAAVLTIVLYMRIVFREINDDSARYSRLRREDYQAQQLRVALTGLATIVVIVLITVVLAWIL